jgi:hypothetical protein
MALESTFGVMVACIEETGIKVNSMV